MANVTARAPSGKTRIVQQCTECKRIKYKHLDETRYVDVRGALSTTRTVDESWCTGSVLV